MEISKFIAHRGGTTYAPENSMDAFKRTLEIGVDFIELDVQMTIDGHLVIFHDTNNERMTGHKSSITDITLNEVNNLNLIMLGNNSGFHKIPTLNEYLTWMEENPTIKTNIEIKVKDYFDKKYEIALTGKIIKLLESHPNLKERLLISTFSMFSLEEIYKTSNYTLSMLICFTKNWEHSLEEFLNKHLANFKKWNCISLGINSDYLDDDRISFLKEKCKTVISYSMTTFSQKQVVYLLSCGIDGLFIDEIKQAELTFESIPKPIKFGFLATGSEIAYGNCINTTSGKMANELHDKGYRIGMHITCRDARHEIERATRYLLSEHDAVIITGGLGLTSDDKTKVSISYVTGENLIFSNDSWDRITNRIKSISNNHILENNKKQAFFPENSKIIINDNGTADGCYLQTNDNKMLWMLPGPPHECFAMFEKVKTQLSTIGRLRKQQKFKWMLFDISESRLQQLISDNFNEEKQTFFGYKADYPYLELKYYVEEIYIDKYKEDLKKINDIVKPYIRNLENIQFATESLKKLIKNNKLHIKLSKDITKGYFLSWIAQQQKFHQDTSDLVLNISTDGLDEYWNNSESINKTDKVSITINNSTFFWKVSLINQDELKSVLEWFCWQIEVYIQNLNDNIK